MQKVGDCRKFVSCLPTIPQDNNNGNTSKGMDDDINFVLAKEQSYNF